MGSGSVRTIGFASTAAGSSSRNSLHGSGSEEPVIGIGSGKRPVPPASFERLPRFPNDRWSEIGFALTKQDEQAARRPTIDAFQHGACLLRARKSLASSSPKSIVAHIKVQMALKLSRSRRNLFPDPHIVTISRNDVRTLLRSPANRGSPPIYRGSRSISFNRSLSASPFSFRSAGGCAEIVMRSVSSYTVVTGEP